MTSETSYSKLILIILERGRTLDGMCGACMVLLVVRIQPYGRREALFVSGLAMAMAGPKSSVSQAVHISYQQSLTLRGS